MSEHQTDPLAEHVDAFQRGDRKEFWRLVREQRASTPEELTVVHELLDEYADALLDAAHERWNRRIGSFLFALGLGPSDGLAEDWLTQRYPQWAGTFRTNALAIAQGQLRAAYEDGSKLTVSYAHELIYVGWRIDYLAGLEAIGKDKPHLFIRSFLAAPFAGPGGLDVRCQVAADLADEMYGCSEAMDADFWWEVWGPFKPDAPADEQPDTALRTLELLRERVARLT